MKYRIKEVVADGGRWYYPQRKSFLFWSNFEDWYRGVKWMRKWVPFFENREGAEKYLDKRRSCGG